MHVILIGTILCFVFHFLIVKSTDSSLNISWLKRPAQGLYFVLSTDVVNTMLVSISIVCSSAQQETRKNTFFLVHTCLVTSDFMTLHSPVQNHTSHFLHLNPFYLFFIIFLACRASTEIESEGSNWPITAVFYCKVCNFFC